jgi:phospholipase/carboxylesterase
MTSRFSSDLFDEPQTADLDELWAAAQMYADLVPSPHREAARESDVADELAALGLPADQHDVFVPAHYEPNYAYPLLVWLENSSVVPGRLDRRMRQISDRNYFGVSIFTGEGDQLEEQLTATFQRLRRQYHLNTERVYLIGSGDAGTRALATGLSQPGCFAGIAALSAHWPAVPRLLLKYDALRGKRVLLGTSAADDATILAGTTHGARLLWTAGVQVTTLTTGDGAEPNLMREIDRWVMQTIEEPELVC